MFLFFTCPLHYYVVSVRLCDDVTHECCVGSGLIWSGNQPRLPAYLPACFPPSTTYHTHCVHAPQPTTTSACFLRSPHCVHNVDTDTPPTDRVLGSGTAPSLYYVLTHYVCCYCFQVYDSVHKPLLYTCTFVAYNVPISFCSVCIMYVHVWRWWLSV